MSDYTDLATLKAFLGPVATGTTYDTALNLAISTASRAIENYCHRRFWLDATAAVRAFEATDPYRLLIPDLGHATVTVTTDADADGTFETTWASTDIQLEPVNAAFELPEAQPWTEIRAVGTRSFPLATTRRRNRVQVTGRWGWPAVPDAITEACLIKAARLFHRRNSPQGIAAFDEFGPVRVSRSEDGDVVLLLDPYRYLVVA